MSEIVSREVEESRFGWELSSVTRTSFGDHDVARSVGVAWWGQAQGTRCLPWGYLGGAAGPDDGLCYLVVIKYLVRD